MNVVLTFSGGQEVEHVELWSFLSSFTGKEKNICRAGKAPVSRNTPSPLVLQSCGTTSAHFRHFKVILETFQSFSLIVAKRYSRLEPTRVLLRLNPKLGDELRQQKPEKHWLRTSPELDVLHVFRTRGQQRNSSRRNSSVWTNLVPQLVEGGDHPCRSSGSSLFCILRLRECFLFKLKAKLCFWRCFVVFVFRTLQVTVASIRTNGLLLGS